MKTKLFTLVAMFWTMLATAQTATQFITQGLDDLGPVADNLWGANTNFSAALALSPTNETANALVAATRLLVLPQQSAGSNFLNQLGVPGAGRDLYDWTAMLPGEHQWQSCFSGKL